MKPTCSDFENRGNTAFALGKMDQIVTITEEYAIDRK